MPPAKHQAQAAQAPVSGQASGPPEAAADRGSNTQRAYAEIRRRILDNTMPAGSQYLEQEMAALLGMSRTPVREALIRLAEERLVEVRPRHGVRVLPISPADMRDIYELLTELESLAARRVAEKGVSPHQIRALEQTITGMDTALARNDLAGWARADERFHSLLVAYSGNSRLVTTVSTFMDQVHRARMQTLAHRPRPVDSTRDHADLVKAIKARDPATAAKIHRAHRERAGSMLVALIERLGLSAV
jgi:DNA-binding GntR family transcriptional regulator